MQDLHLVGFTTDRRHLIFSARRGAKSGSFLVPVDEELARIVAELAAEPAPVDDEAVEEPVAPPPPRVEAKLTVREVQARLRAGESTAEVAADAGVEEEWVERFAPPVRAEQRQVVERALRLPMERSRAGESAKPLGVAVASAMAERGVVFTDDGFAASWSSRLIGQDHWIIEFHFTQRGRKRTVGWTFDAAEGRITTNDRTASQIGFVAPPPAKPGGKKTPASASSSATTDADDERPAQGPRSTRGDGRPDTVQSTKAVAAAAASTKKALASRPAAAKKQAAAAKKAAAKKKAASEESAAKKKSGAKKKPATKNSGAKRSGAKKTAAPKKKAGTNKKTAPKKKAAPKKKSGAKKTGPKQAGTKKQPTPENPERDETAPHPAATTAEETLPERASSTTPDPVDEPIDAQSSTEAAPEQTDEGPRASATRPAPDVPDDDEAPIGDATGETSAAADAVADDAVADEAGTDRSDDESGDESGDVESVRIVAAPQDDAAPEPDNRVRVRRAEPADAGAGSEGTRRNARPTAAFRSGAAVRASSAQTTTTASPTPASDEQPARSAEAGPPASAGPSREADTSDRANGRRSRRTRQLRAR